MKDYWLYKSKNYFLKKVGTEKNSYIFRDGAPFRVADLCTTLMNGLLRNTGIKRWISLGKYSVRSSYLSACMLSRFSCV